MGMSAATIGIYGSRAAFWPMPSHLPHRHAAAGAIALINATGNLGGYVGPFVVGWIKDSTGSFEAGLYFLAASASRCCRHHLLRDGSIGPDGGACASRALASR